MLRSSSVRRSPEAIEVNYGPRAPSEHCTIRDAWAWNMDEEINAIRRVVQKYDYVAVDTEFPGVLVSRPKRLAITKLRDEEVYAEDSIPFLIESGIQFDKLEREGIDANEFAQRCTTSGIVLSDSVKCLVFYGAYDFGYLLKVLAEKNLPQEESEFFELLQMYFPAIYDIKCIMASFPGAWGGLQNVANSLQVERVERQHEEGSDTLLSGPVFFEMGGLYFRSIMD